MASFDFWCWNKHPGKKLLGKKRWIWLTVPGYSSLLRKPGKKLKVSNPVKSRGKTNISFLVSYTVQDDLFRE